MADKPSRALVIYGDGHASLLSPSHAHLHSFASRASCGFLSLRTPPPTVEGESDSLTLKKTVNGGCFVIHLISFGSYTLKSLAFSKGKKDYAFYPIRNNVPQRVCLNDSIKSENDRVARELAQLLDAYDFYTARNGQHEKADAYANLKESSILTVVQRFNGLRAAIITACPNVRSFARELGFSVLKIDELIMQNDPSEKHLQELPDELTSKLLKLLGFSGGKVLEKSEFDLVILHIRTSEKSKDLKEKMVDGTGVDWLNKLIGGIMQATQPGLDIASRLHFSIILSYGTVSASGDSCSFILNSGTETDSNLSFLRPCQSYNMKGGKILNDIRHHHPMLIAQWQEGVTRSDMAREFSFKEFKEHGGNLAILADRFLHEVAFKLWKAPKYGA